MQGIHAVDEILPMSEFAVPAGHGRQAGWPGRELYVPLRQEKHCVSVELLAKGPN